MAHINGLFCGLHILQNMATAALNGMKTFEKANNVSNPNIYMRAILFVMNLL
jgi:hypothetical protein